MVKRVSYRKINGGKGRKAQVKLVLVRVKPVYGGVSSVRLPNLRKGKHKVTATYTGPGGVSTDRTTIRVKPRQR